MDKVYRYSMQDPVTGCKVLGDEKEIERTYYDNRSESFSPTQPGFNGWGSEFSQVLRFDVLIEEIRKDLTYKRAVLPYNEFKVLDFGCGSGDLQDYLPKKDFLYLGVDIRKDVEGPNIFGGIDIFSNEFDYLLEQYCFHPHYCVASGAFGFMEVPEVERTIDRLVEISKFGVVFNLLDAKSDYMGSEPVVHVQRKRFFSYIFNRYRIGKKYEVRMRNDYFPNEDFTIGIFK